MRSLALTAFVASFTLGAWATGIITAPRAVGAFQSEDDGRCHAVVAQSSGTIVDVTHDCGGGIVATTVLARLVEPVAISGYYARNDNFRHVIVGLNNGDLFDIRFKPGIAPAPIRLINIRAFGPIVSLAAWTDVHNNKNIAILSKWFTGASVVSVYQANVGQPGKMHFLRIFPEPSMIDIAGEYVYWDNSNKVQIAVGAGGASSMKMISWAADLIPDQSNIESSFEGTNTPWVTNFPGSNAPSESIVSIGGNSGYYSGYAPWAAMIGMAILDTANQIKIFGANNGGGAIADGPFDLFAVAVHSIAGPHFTGIPSGTPRIQLVVAGSDGRLFSLSADQPDSSKVAPAWQFVQIGAF